MYMLPFPFYQLKALDGVTVTRAFVSKFRSAHNLDPMPISSSTSRIHHNHIFVRPGTVLVNRFRIPKRKIKDLHHVTEFQLPLLPLFCWREAPPMPCGLRFIYSHTLFVSLGHGPGYILRFIFHTSFFASHINQPLCLKSIQYQDHLLSKQDENQKAALALRLD